MPWNDGLTGAHLNIAAHDGESLRVVAGPGTGKTFALMRRIARLLESEVPPEEILAVTFTRTSAKDLVDQLGRLGIAGAERVVARTLHSLSFSLLHANAVFEITGRQPRVLLQHERAMLVADLARAFGGKRKVEALIKAFEAYWARLQHQEPGWPSDPTERAFDAALKQWLAFHEAMLVGELVPLAYDFVRMNPQSPYVPRFAHIVVDEYQDLNRADQALIDALARAAQTVTVVGDEDQSIYAFRHANPDGITQYDRRHAGTHDELLEECRRCPCRVVAMASALVQRNRRARDSVLQSRPTNGEGDVTIVQHASLREEAQSLASFTQHYLTQHPDVRPGEVLVLTNRKRMGYAIRDRMNAEALAAGAGWRARSFFVEESLDTLTAQEGFTLLALHANPADRAALRTWLGLRAPSNDGRASAYGRLRAHCELNGLAPAETLEKLARGELRLPYTNGLVERYQELQRRLAALQGLSHEQLLDALFPDDGDCEDLREIARAALDTSEDATSLLDGIRSAVTQPELPGDQGDFVRIMSMHKSKGLTARVVIVAGCVEGALPSFDPRLPESQQREREEEQRRLFYVALTRTTETLVLSSAVRMSAGEALQMGLPDVRRQYGQVVLPASRFLAELGASAPPVETTSEWRRRVGFTSQRTARLAEGAGAAD